MQHFLLTKLAVGTPPIEWLEQRLFLFEHFCAPSILAQTDKGFRWILAVNETTPYWFIDRAAAAAAGATFVYPTGPSLAPDWGRLLRPIIAEGACITTRCDSDDMLHARFIARVRELAERSTGDEVIDFPVGLQLRLPDYAHRTLRQDRPTHFISLVERRGFKRGVYGFFHNEADRYFPVRTASTLPAWVEIAHGANIVNTVRDEDIQGIIPYHALMDRMAGGPL